MNLDVARIKETLASPEWWVTAIIAGLLMSLVAAYLKQGLDRFLATSSKSWRELRRWRKKEREDRIGQASEDPHAFLSMVAREMRVRFRLVCYLVGAFGLYMFVLAFSFAGLGRDAWYWYARVAGALVLLWGAEAWTLFRVRLEIYEAQRLRRQNQPSERS